MRNLWAQVLELRGIYLCLGAGWSTTQVWALRRDWGDREKGNDTQILEPGTALEPFWRIGQSLVHWCAPLSVYPPGKRKDWTHTLAKGRAAVVAERERERQLAAE
ncbi:hypothetical protein CSIM01_05699 [Colletotrichum simmondsii]|uniref:Uncharacterized protein n=1 Tax=Colletotrichum simmondsii TaxID=703756 RepID=A0A135SRN1_9PEZI|nr:hypothetical protein CSIM01_05699 [Colletotrichum simmondsii]